MDNPFSELSRFCWAVINNWAGYSTGGIVVATAAFWHILRDVPMSRRFGLGLAVVFLFMAFFKAWRDQYRSRIMADHKLRIAEPDFVLSFGQIVVKHDSTRDITALLIQSHLLNRGADSVALGWRAHYKSKSYDDEATVNVFAEDAISLPFGSNEYKYVIGRDDLMPIKTIRSITRGNITMGALFIVVPGNRFDEVLAGAATITVSVNDYLGKCYSVDYVSAGQKTEQQYSAGVGSIYS